MHKLTFERIFLKITIHVLLYFKVEFLHNESSYLSEKLQQEVQGVYFIHIHRIS